MSMRAKLACGAAAAAVVGWLPVVRGQFVNWDDAVLLGARGWQGLGPQNWAWWLSSRVNGTWQPAGWCAYALLFQAFGPSTAAFHAAGLLVHGACAALLALIAFRLSKSAPAALGAALLFALHPVQGEAVALAASLSDQLACAFALASVLCCLEERPRAMLAAFVLGCLSRWTGVLAAPALWLLGARAQGRWAQRGVFLFAGVALVFNAWAKNSMGAAGAFSVGGFLRATAELSSRWVWPATLLPVYPGTLARFTTGAALALVASLTLALALSRRAWPEGAAAWALLSAACVLPAFSSAGPAFLAADRYLYLPSAALSGAVALGALRLSARRPALALPLFGLALGLSAAGALACWNRAPKLKDSEALWTSVLAAAPGNVLAHTRLAMARFSAGDVAGAERVLEDLSRYDAQAGRRNLARLKILEAALERSRR